MYVTNTVLQNELLLSVAESGDITDVKKALHNKANVDYVIAQMLQVIEHVLITLCYNIYRTKGEVNAESYILITG